MADEPTRRLEVTRRCLEEDLRLPREADWHDYLEQFPVLRAFHDRSGQRAEGDEPIQQVLRVLPQAPVFSLHSGNDRGGTWHDEEDDIVWLVGIGASHDYDHFETLARRGQLLPTDDDYDRLEPDIPDPFDFERIGREARALREEARTRPGIIVLGVLAERIQVRVCFEGDDPPVLTVAVSERILAGPSRIPEAWKYIVAQAFFPSSGFPEDYFPFAEEIDQDAIRSNELGLVNFLIETV